MNLKKIKWKNNDMRLSYYKIKGRHTVSIVGEFMDFEDASFYIDNFYIKRKGEVVLTPDKFYLDIKYKSFHRLLPDVFNSLEEAKEAAQEECLKFFVQKYFESPPKRTVLVEKSKRKKYIKKERQPTLVLANVDNGNEDEWTFFNLA
jgi:hypothetical protein